MKRYLILAFVLAGCGGITNDEIIVEVKKCQSAGMTYTLQRNVFYDGVTSVVCDYGKEKR